VYYGLADARIKRVLREAEEILAGVAERIYACTRYER
jgi:hypothetical protein